MSGRAICGVRALGHGLRWWVPFLVVGLAAHGLLLIDDGLYLDDWWFLQWMQEGRFADLLHMQVGMGYHVEAWFHWALRLLPDPAAGHRWFAFAAVVLSGGLLARIVHAAGLASPRQALVTGLLAVAAPAHRALDVFSLDALVGYVAAFLGGVLLLLRAEPLDGTSRLWRRASGLGLFWISFYLNSLLVPYVAGATVLTVRAWLRDRRTRLPWLRAHWPFLLLPWAFWGLKLLLIHALGVEAGEYNEIRWDVSGLLLVYEEAFRTYAVIARGWLRPTFMGLLAAALVVVLLARRRLDPEPVSRRSGARLALLGAAFFLMGVLPYAAVGKGLGPPGAHWASHYAVLLSAPLAMLVVGAVVTIWGSLSRASSVLALAVLAIWSIEAVGIHMHWQAEAIKWKAVCQQVGRSRGVRDASIVAVVDQWPLGMHDSVEGGSTPPMIWFGQRVTRLHFTSGFTPFFDHFCARGARKLAGWVPVPDREGHLDAARDVLDVLRRDGALPRDGLDALGRALHGDATVAAIGAVVGAHPTIFLDGLRRLELENGHRALRSRVYLSLLGLPAGPAVETRLHEAISASWGALHTHAVAQPSPSVLVLVQPGPGYRAVPVGHRGWWRQARRLWAGYQVARLRGPAAVGAFLDRVAAVEVRQLTR